MRYNESAILFSVLVLILCLLGSEAFCREGDHNARGRIDRVKNGNFEIVVEGTTTDGPLWLGCTLFPGEDRERDLEAKQSSKRFLFICKGNFEKKFDVPNRLTSGLSVVRGGKDHYKVPYVVALWRWKIDRSECRNGRDGGPCKWCRNNGYHLEDRVDIGRGTWSYDDEGSDRKELLRGQRSAEKKVPKSQEHMVT